MTKPEIAAALKIARDSNHNLDGVDISILDGLCLPLFGRVTTTLEVVAKSLRWHVITLTGGVDNDELNNMSSALKNKVTIVG